MRWSEAMTAVTDGPKCAYDILTEFIWLQRMLEGVPGEVQGGFSLVEKCPRCTHTLTWDTEQVVESVGSATLQAASLSFRIPTPILNTPGEVYIACNCHEPHDGRPKDQLGCGQAGLFNFWTDPPTARPADSEYAAWAEQAQKEDLQALSGVRATAAKWSGSIAALTGAFGIVAFLKTPSDISVLSQTGQHWLLGILGIAVILDMCALGCAAWASQGKPQSTWTNAATYKARSRSDARSAAKFLGWSRALTVATLIALMLGVGVLWSGQPAAPSSPATPLLVTAGGRVLCGQPQVAPDGTLGLQIAGGATPIPLAGVTNVVSVVKCQ
jgi:hypothetical protein